MRSYRKSKPKINDNNVSWSTVNSCQSGFAQYLSHGKIIYLFHYTHRGIVQRAGTRAGEKESSECFESCAMHDPTAAVSCKKRSIKYNTVTQLSKKSIHRVIRHAYRSNRLDLGGNSGPGNAKSTDEANGEGPPNGPSKFAYDPMAGRPEVDVRTTVAGGGPSGFPHFQN